MQFLYNQSAQGLLDFAAKNPNSRVLDCFKVGYPQPKSLIQYGKVGIYK